MEETTLLRQLQGGDIQALAALVQAYQVEALRLAYGIVRDRSLAEDIVQAAFLAVYDQRRQFDLARPFRPWFFRIVVNGALKAAQKHARLSPLDTPAAAGHPPPALIDQERSPLDHLVAAETAAEVWAALHDLAPAQRAVLLQRYYLGLSEAEMSQRLAVPSGTIKSRLFQARKQLARLLQPILRPGGAPAPCEERSGEL
ncbi:MAG TPA: RNA polymerase sigma factor [Herpetosiphonaceae bacterium]